MVNLLAQASKVGKINLLERKSLDTQSYLDVELMSFY